ncbi:MAG: TetR/AcrR family transcriptional regulator [Gemmatimonadaceae bacterium]
MHSASAWHILGIRRNQLIYMRNVPRQSRSKQTVQYILDAAAYILAERGLEGFTTNHIAERAGVNIASLYQYFPNKTAILDALQARHVGKPAQIDTETWKRLLELPLAELLVELVDAALAEHAENPALHRTLLMRLPRGMRDAEPSGRNEMLSAMLLTKAREARRPEMMVFTARHALLGAIDEAVCGHPDWLRDPDFRDELVRLVLRYLELRPNGRGGKATGLKRLAKDASPSRPHR